jgi:hypothetical protein
MIDWQATVGSQLAGMWSPAQGHHRFAAAHGPGGRSTSATAATTRAVAESNADRTVSPTRNSSTVYKTARRSAHDAGGGSCAARPRSRRARRRAPSTTASCVLHIWKLELASCARPASMMTRPADPVSNESSASAGRGLAGRRMKRLALQPARLRASALFGIAPGEALRHAGAAQGHQRLPGGPAMKALFTESLFLASGGRPVTRAGRRGLLVRVQDDRRPLQGRNGPVPRGRDQGRQQGRRCDRQDRHRHRAHDRRRSERQPRIHR